jgi:RecA-family ATPase
MTIHNHKENSPASVQAERDCVNSNNRSNSQFEDIPTNDNEQVVSHAELPAPRFEIFEYGKHAPPPKAEAFIEGFLYPGQFSLLFGPSGIGKSALVLDMLVRASLGLTWGGKQTKPADVLWVPTENPYELQRRLNVCLNTHSSLNTMDARHWFSESQFHLADGETKDNMDAIAQHLSSQQRDRQQVVVFDTLSQAIPGLDENSASLMSLVAYNLRYLQSKLPDVHVMLVHHSGKELARGARGHSALTAAADTEIGVTKTQLRVLNQRSGASGAIVKYALRQLEHTDEYGEVHSSVGVDYP